MAYISIDFGSANTGALLNGQRERSYQIESLIYVHRSPDSSSTKQQTVFWVRRDLLEKADVNNLDDVLNIKSVVFPSTPFAEANFIWCRRQIKDTIKDLKAAGDEWVCFRNPKMRIYSDVKTIKGSDGRTYNLDRVLAVFFAVLKRECFHRAQALGLDLATEHIEWALTVPGLGIWEADSREWLREIARKIFGPDIILLVEPECALIGIALNGNSDLVTIEGRHTLVADNGGGTCDFTLMVEHKQPNGAIKFKEVKATPGQADPVASIRQGGNDIDMRFLNLFCELLAEGTEYAAADTTRVFWDDFRTVDPVGAMDLEDSWTRLRTDEHTLAASEVYFDPGRLYRMWLRERCPEAYRRLQDDDGALRISTRLLEEKVFDPVFSAIADTLTQMVSTAKTNDISIDALFFAGGLSLNSSLRQRLSDIVRRYVPEVFIPEMSDAWTIGAIMTGANHLLVNKDQLILRMARRSFFYEVSMEDSIRMGSKLKYRLRDAIMNNYESLNQPLSDEEYDTLLAEQKDAQTASHRGMYQDYLSPMCLRNMAIDENYTATLRPLSNTQTGFHIRVFSTDGDKAFFPAMDGDKLKFEGEIDRDLGHSFESLSLVFDHLSNPLSSSARLIIKDENGNECGDLEVNNVSRRGL